VHHELERQGGEECGGERSALHTANEDVRRHPAPAADLEVLRKEVGRELEEACNDIVVDILENYEGFTDVRKGPSFRGTPFNFFGFKDGRPYMIEFKESLKSFNHPGETKKRRMRELLDRIDGLGAALIQVKIETREYRIFHGKELDALFYGPRVPLKPIEDWIRERI